MDPIHLLSAEEKRRETRKKLMQKILTSLEIDCFIDIRSIFRSHGLSFPIELRCSVFVSGWISMSQLIRLRLTWNMMKVVKKYRTFIFYAKWTEFIHCRIDCVHISVAVPAYHPTFFALGLTPNIYTDPVNLTHFNTIFAVKKNEGGANGTG